MQKRYVVLTCMQAQDQDPSRGAVSAQGSGAVQAEIPASVLAACKGPRWCRRYSSFAMICFFVEKDFMMVTFGPMGMGLAIPKCWIRVPSAPEVIKCRGQFPNTVYISSGPAPWESLAVDQTNMACMTKDEPFRLEKAL